MLFLMPVSNGQQLLVWKTSEDGINLQTTYSPNLAYEKNLLGLPHSWVTVYNQEFGRSSLSLTITGQKTTGWNIEILKKTQSEYQDGRKKWAAERLYKVKKFYPFESHKNLHGLIINTIGFEYEIKNIEYKELSMFIEANNNLLHAKFVGANKLDQWGIFKPIIENLEVSKK